MPRPKTFDSHVPTSRISVVTFEIFLLLQTKLYNHKIFAKRRFFAKKFCFLSSSCCPHSVLKRQLTSITVSFHQFNQKFLGSLQQKITVFVAALDSTQRDSKKSVCLLIQFLFLFRQPSFPRLVRPIEQALIHLYQEEVAGCAGHKVLMVLDLYFTDCW